MCVRFSFMCASFCCVCADHHPSIHTQTFMTLFFLPTLLSSLSLSDDRRGEVVVFVDGNSVENVYE